MPSLNLSDSTAPPWLRRHAYAYLYWLAFLLVLEPGNLFRASQSGQALDLAGEACRIAIAALLGASVTPLLLELTQRWPMLGPLRWRRLPVHAAAAAGLALVLILVSCLLAAWLYEGRWLPTGAQVQAQLVGNFSLLVYALLAYTAIAHILHLVQETPRQAAPVNKVDAVLEVEATEEMEAAPAPRLSRIEVKTRGRLHFLAVSDIDWIETQGNYLALHAGAESHLIRETLLSFEAGLDPSQFVRIHRRMLVAVDRIRALQPAANGDAVLTLADGSELRASRRYREAIQAGWRATSAL